MMTKLKVKSARLPDGQETLKIKAIFFLIIVLAFFLRLFWLDAVPPSASLDEVSIGYNAYSILKTGADEYGTKFPILLRAYDDWRPALYAYLVIPFIQILGLNALAVRLPSVILAILTVIATYFLTKNLFNKVIALLATLFLTISPWHLYLSRLGHEANLAFAFFIFGMMFFLRRSFILAFFCFAVSFFSYQAEKVFLPLFLLGLCFLFRKDLFAHKKHVILGLVMSVLVIIPFIRESLTPNALVRFQGTNVISASRERFLDESIKLAKAIQENDWIGRVIHDRRMIGARIIAEGYLSHFNPTWLFTNPFSDKHKIPGIGVLYFWELPFILVGIVALVKSNVDRKIKATLFLWTLASPIPAAITTEAPHVMRSYTSLPTWQIYSAIGFIFVLTKTKPYLGRLLLCLGLAVIVCVSIFYLFKQYFFIFPKTQSGSFQYALAYSIPFVLKNQDQYERIVFSNQDNLYQSYMFFLFYSKYDPLGYQREGGTRSGGFSQTHTIGKYEFRPIKWSQEKRETLYIGNPPDFPQDVASIPIYYLDGRIGITIVEGE